MEFKKELEKNLIIMLRKCQAKSAKIHLKSIKLINYIVRYLCDDTHMYLIYLS